MDVGIRDLKSHLSEILERVERGEVVSVTNRGRPIARIVPAIDAAPIERGIAEGWLTRVSDEPPAEVEPLRPRPGTPDSTELIRRDRDA